MFLVLDLADKYLRRGASCPLSKSKKWQNRDELTKFIEQATNSNGTNINLPVTKKILKN
jgi:hypothetical protein